MFFPFLQNILILSLGIAISFFPLQVASESDLKSPVSLQMHELMYRNIPDKQSLEQAILLGSRELRRNPGNLEIIFYLGIAYYLQESWQRSLEWTDLFIQEMMVYVNSDKLDQDKKKLYFHWLQEAQRQQKMLRHRHNLEDFYQDLRIHPLSQPKKMVTKEKQMTDKLP